MCERCRYMTVQRKLLYGIAAVVLLSAGIVVGVTLGNSNAVAQPNLVSDTQEQQEDASPYAGQQDREIKYLAHSDVEALQNGEGGALGGLAKPAELNSYPGPRHALDNAEKLNLSEEQETELETLFEEMQAESQPVGQEYLEVEKKIDDGYETGNMSEEELETRLDRSGELYGELRYIHLKYHFQTKEILTDQQVKQYNQIRGYAAEGEETSHGDH